MIKFGWPTVVAYCVGVLFGAYLLRPQKRKRSEFVYAGCVERLFIHPIKSCRGVEVDFVDCTPRGAKNGFLRDREFLVVDEANDHQFLTARAFPSLVLVEAEVDEDELRVRLPGEWTVRVGLEEVTQRNDVRRAHLHDNKRADGLDCGDLIADAFTRYLRLEGKRRCRLLRFSEDLYTERDLMASDDVWNNPVPKGFQDHILYADSTSFTINTRGSLENLNDRLMADKLEPVDIRNFRPVIFVDGPEAFEEDRWSEVEIGDAKLIAFRPCSRCVMTTVDPNSGIADKKMQPLKKLKEYRLAPEGKLRKFFKQKPIFGVHLGVQRCGRIRVGDSVFVSYKHSAF
ncbi:MOSC domain-containing protein [Aphelenchoides besseyi]|nr:MOSC domain-containing protein [Aphelenchoides besseyi]